MIDHSGNEFAGTKRLLGESLSQVHPVDQDALISAARARSSQLNRQRIARQGIAAMVLAATAVVGVILVPSRLTIPESETITGSDLEMNATPDSDPLTPPPVAGIDSEDPAINLEFFDRPHSDPSMPVNELWDFLSGDDGRTLDELLANQDALVAACMEAAGFDYTIFDVDNSEQRVDEHGHVKGSVELAQAWAMGMRQVRQKWIPPWRLNKKDATGTRCDRNPNSGRRILRAKGKRLMNCSRGTTP